MESLSTKDDLPSYPITPVKIKREYHSTHRRRVTHPHGTRAKSLQASFDDCQDNINVPTEKDTSSIIEINSSPETRPSKKSKPSERFVGCCTCGPTSKCSDRRCTCRKHHHLCASCTSKCCSNSNDSDYETNTAPSQKEDSKDSSAPNKMKSPTSPTLSPLTQPSVVSVIDDSHAESNEDDSKTNDSDYYDGPTQNLPS